MKNKKNMKKIAPLLLLIFLLGCEREEVSTCFQAPGTVVQKEISLSAFEEIIVYGRIRLIIEQGEEQKVVVKAGRNLIDKVSAEVENNRLVLRDGYVCDLLGDFNQTTVHIIVPNVTWLQNAGNNSIESIGELHFPEIWLRSLNQEKETDVYTNGDFRLHLISDYVRITSDNYSNFFLSGQTGTFKVYIADGDSRVEAAPLIARTVDIQHRGTNKLIVNPQETIKGEIRSTGDVISINRPPLVKVETFYSGKMVFH